MTDEPSTQPNTLNEMLDLLPPGRRETIRRSIAKALWKVDRFYRSGKPRYGRLSRFTSDVCDKCGEGIWADVIRLGRPPADLRALFIDRLEGVSVCGACVPEAAD